MQFFMKALAQTTQKKNSRVTVSPTVMKWSKSEAERRHFTEIISSKDTHIVILAGKKSEFINPVSSTLHTLKNRLPLVQP
jgi:hypothetical protein